MKKYLQGILKQRHISFVGLRKIQGEASVRSFFRIMLKDPEPGGCASLMAMVYPQEAGEEIQRIIRFTDLYREYGLHVPAVRDQLDNRVLLLEDLGDLLLQKELGDLKKAPNLLKVKLDEIADILLKLKGIPVQNTAAVLDKSRMKWEMDFFMTHFAPFYIKSAESESGAEELRNGLHRIVDRIGANDTFAHRDFHSRNMLVFGDKIHLVDFQDSLKSPPYYDLVSFAFDSYLDLKELRQYLFARLRDGGMVIDDEQLNLCALQRNIKALGTFGYQVNVRKNLTYKKYIHRTLRHIGDNPADSLFTMMPG